MEYLIGGITIIIISAVNMGREQRKLVRSRQASALTTMKAVAACLLLWELSVRMGKYSIKRMLHINIFRSPVTLRRILGNLRKIIKGVYFELHIMQLCRRFESQLLFHNE